MAGLPAINGLYVTFFHLLSYFFFGTSKHISPGLLDFSKIDFNSSIQANILNNLIMFKGAFPIVSLMVLGSIKMYEGILYSQIRDIPLNGNISTNSTANIIASKNDSFISNDPEEAKILLWHFRFFQESFW